MFFINEFLHNYSAVTCKNIYIKYEGAIILEQNREIQRGTDESSGGH